MVFRPRASACSCTDRRDAVGGEDDGGALGHLVELLDEDRAPRLEVGDDVLVVHDLLADVDRGAVEVQRLLDGDHRPVDAGAVAARCGQQHALARRFPDRRSCPGVYGPTGVGSSRVTAWPWRPHRPRPRRSGRSLWPSPSGSAGSGPCLGRGADGPDQPPTGRRHRVHDAARLRRRHLGAGHLRPHAVRQPQPAARRGRQRGRPRQARLLRQPRLAVAGRAARSGWSGSASCSPGSSAGGSCSRPRGCSTPRCKQPLPFLPGRVGLVTAPRLGRRARRRGERPPPLARRHASRRRTPRCRARAPPPR